MTAGTGLEQSADNGRSVGVFGTASRTPTPHVGCGSTYMGQSARDWLSYTLATTRCALTHPTSGLEHKVRTWQICGRRGGLTLLVSGQGQQRAVKPLLPDLIYGHAANATGYTSAIKKVKTTHKHRSLKAMCVRLGHWVAVCLSAPSPASSEFIKVLCGAFLNERLGRTYKLASAAIKARGDG